MKHYKEELVSTSAKQPTESREDADARKKMLAMVKKLNSAIRDCEQVGVMCVTFGSGSTESKTPFKDSLKRTRVLKMPISKLRLADALKGPAAAFGDGQHDDQVPDRLHQAGDDNQKHSEDH